jgi:outer membrane protein insertion porin family
MHEIIQKGEEAAQAALPRIRELLRPKAVDRSADERFRVTDLLIRGNAIVPEAVIRAAMTLPLSPDEVSRNDLFDAMIDVYRLGVFADVALDLEKAGNGTRAILTVVENPVVWNIAISGNTVITKEEVLTALDWQKGWMLNITRLAGELDKITKKCRGQGYLLTRVERAGMNVETSTLEIVMFEGRVDSISIVGQNKTRRSLIQRETVTRAGQPLNFDLAAYDIQHLYALNYFESLSADMAKSTEGGIGLTLRIREKPTTRVRLGLRYDLEDRFTGLTDIIVDNVTGRGIKAYLNMRYGNYTDFTLGYRSPVLLHSNFVHSVQAFYRGRQYYEYENKHRINEFEVTRTGAELAFGYQWFRFGDTYLRYRYATDEIEETIGMAPRRDEERIGTFAFLSTIDTRDRNTFPGSGLLFKGSYETAQRAYGSAHEFSKTCLYAQGAIPLAPAHTLLLEGSAGLGSGIIPYQERFGIGGADYLLGFPLMGYERREFTGSNELGFSAAYRWRMKEYHLKAVKAVYLNGAVQAANVWDERDAMSFSDLRTGGGIGLHADTIIGPVRLDFGWGEQSRYTVYFSAGYDF